MKRGSAVSIGVCAAVAVIAIAAAACGGKKGGGGPATVTVDGYVKTFYGTGVSGEQVMINGVITTTDSSGHFSIPDVATPYDLVLNDILGGAVLEFVGVTIANPVLPSQGGAPQSHSTTLSGTLTPSVGTGLGVTAFIGPNDLTNGYAYGPDAFSMTPQWAIGSSVAGHLIAVRYTTDASGMVTTIPSMGTLANLTLSDGVAQSNLSIAMTSVTTGTVTASVSAPANYTVYSLGASAREAASGRLFFSLGVSTASSAAFTSIAEQGFDVSLGAVALPPGATGFELGSTQASQRVDSNSATALTLISLPELTAPAANGTLQAGDTITLTPGSSAAGRFGVFLYDPNAIGPSVFILSNDSSFVVPDLSPLGLGGTPTAYKLQVTENHPGAPIDDYLVDFPPDLFAGQFAQGPATDVTASF